MAHVLFQFGLLAGGILIAGLGSARAAHQKPDEVAVRAFVCATGFFFLAAAVAKYLGY